MTGQLSCMDRSDTELYPTCNGSAALHRPESTPCFNTHAANTEWQGWCCFWSMFSETEMGAHSFNATTRCVACRTVSRCAHAAPHADEPRCSVAPHACRATPREAARSAREQLSQLLMHQRRDISHPGTRCLWHNRPQALQLACDRCCRARPRRAAACAAAVGALTVSPRPQSAAMTNAC